jgi:hypothetical protein
LNNANVDEFIRIHVTDSGTDSHNDKSGLIKEKKTAVFQEMHDKQTGGHLGMNRTYNRMKRFIKWPGMT